MVYLDYDSGLDVAVSGEDLDNYKPKILNVYYMFSVDSISDLDFLECLPGPSSTLHPTATPSLTPAPNPEICWLRRLPRSERLYGEQEGFRSDHLDGDLALFVMLICLFLYAAAPPLQSKQGA
jgi:hypothetical protein